MDRKDLQKLSRLRLKESKVLLQHSLCDGAYYLAGYAVECALKACIAKSTARHEFPDKNKVNASYTHKLKDLVGVAGLETARLDRARTDLAFRANWNVVQLWTEESRYERRNVEAAQALFDAVADRRHGVLSWIRLHW